MTTKNWTTVSEFSFPWERESLEFVRSQFPNHEPYRAWTNFEYVAGDGSGHACRTIDRASWPPTIERADRREAELLEMLPQPEVLRREGFTEHELGPALIFEHDPTAMRLEHFLTQHHDQLTVGSSARQAG